MGRLLHVGLFLGAAAVTLFVLQARATPSPEKKAEVPLSERYREEIERDPVFGALIELFEEVGRKRALEAELIRTLEEVGGEEARTGLVDYLREPDSDLVAEAAVALRRVDPEAARLEARALLEGPRRLTSEQARTLRECAGN